jgi:hypothetical protein
LAAGAAARPAACASLASLCGSATAAKQNDEALTCCDAHACLHHAAFAAGDAAANRHCG